MWDCSMQDSGQVYPEGCAVGIHEFGGGLTCPLLALGREPLHASSSSRKGSKDGVFLPTHAGGKATRAKHQEIWKYNNSTSKAHAEV